MLTSKNCFFELAHSPAMYRNVTFSAYSNPADPVDWLLLHRKWSGVDGG